MAENINTDHIQTIALGPLDHIASSNIPQSIIYLSLKQGTSPQDAFNCLREGLHRTLLQTPWLAGRVHYQSQDAPGWRPGQLEIRYTSNANAIPSTSAELLRNGSGQGHSIVNFPVRNEGGRCVRLLILYGVSVVNV
jgi:hypothetical protein